MDPIYDNVMEILFLDTETTGFGESRLVELAYRSPGEEMTLVRVRPPIPISESAAQAHGITDEMCKDWPLFAELPDFPLIQRRIESSVVIAHYASFDVGVLNREGIMVPVYIDTCSVARALYPHLKNHKLQSLRQYFNIEIDARAHSAEGDVLVLEALYAQMRSDLEARGTAPDDVLRQMMLATAR